MLYGLGTTIGAGLFSAVGTAASFSGKNSEVNSLLGPSIWMCFLINGLLSLASSLVYGEFAS